MRKLILPAAAVAALCLAPTPSQAQYVIRSGYVQPYYGGYSTPYYGGYTQPYYSAPIGNGGLVQAAEGYLLNQTGLGNYVAPYTTGYGSYSTFGAQPYYGGYSSFTPYAGGNYRTYGGNGWGWGRRR